MRISYIIYLNIFRYFSLHYDSFCICIKMMLLSFANTKQPQVLFFIFSHFNFKSSSYIATSINSYDILLRTWEIVQKYMTHSSARAHESANKISFSLLWNISLYVIWQTCVVYTKSKHIVGVLLNCLMFNNIHLRFPCTDYSLIALIYLINN